LKERLRRRNPSIDYSARSEDGMSDGIGRALFRALLRRSWPDSPFRDVRPIDIFLECLQKDVPDQVVDASESLAAHGLRPVDLRFYMAHGRHPAEERPRSVPDSALAELVMLNDEYTTFAFVLEVLTRELQIAKGDAADLAALVHRDGRGTVSSGRAEELYRVRDAIESRAEAAGYPLLLEVVPRRTDGSRPST
jgi:ATP-dependent Clp protease adapter protein ClpS